MKTALIALVVCAATATSHAERDASNKLGFLVAFDKLPIADHDMMQMGIGLAIEHPVFTHWRVFGEYEWLWLSAPTPEPMDVELRGSGHRTSVGIRHEITGGTLAKVLRFYVDGEVGGGLGLFSDNLMGAHIVPDGFAGVRLGYTVVSRDQDDHPPRGSFGCALLLRALVVEQGAGGLFAIAFDWGG